MALDDANHLYYVDTNVADDTFTRWKVNGLGNVTLETTRPLIPAAQFVDDRPWGLGPYGIAAGCPSGQGPPAAGIMLRGAEGRQALKRTDAG